MSARIAALLLALAGVIGLTVATGTGSPAGDRPEFVTICHAAGREGTTKFVTLTLPYNAVYGQAGHFNENGTPAAGHEDDYLGPCVEDTTTTSSTTVPESTTTVPESTTTVPESTTTVPESTTTVPVEDTTTTSSTSVPVGDTTTTSVVIDTTLPPPVTTAPPATLPPTL